MTEYDYEDVAAAELEPDPRIVAMHRVVDLERQYEAAARESEQRQKMAEIVRQELSEARDELAGLLGYPSRMSKVQAMSGEEARAIVKRRFPE